MTPRAAFFHASAATIEAADLIVCRQPDALRFLVEAARGSRHTAWVLTAVDDVLHQLDAASRRAPLLCASCPTPIQPEVACAFVLHLPEDQWVLYAFAPGICWRCGTSRAEVRRQAVLALRRELPSLRVVGATHAAGGRA